MGAGIGHVIFSLSLSSKWSNEKKIQMIQMIWASHKNNWCDYDQPNKNEENKEKKPKPDTGGHDKPFWKNKSKRQKGRKQAQSDP